MTVFREKLEITDKDFVNKIGMYVDLLVSSIREEDFVFSSSWPAGVCNFTLDIKEDDEVSPESYKTVGLSSIEWSIVADDRTALVAAYTYVASAVYLSALDIVSRGGTVWLTVDHRNVRVVYGELDGELWFLPTSRVAPEVACALLSFDPSSGVMDKTQVMFWSTMKELYATRSLSFASSADTEWIAVGSHLGWPGLQQVAESCHKSAALEQALREILEAENNASVGYFTAACLKYMITKDRHLFDHIIRQVATKCAHDKVPYWGLVHRLNLFLNSPVTSLFQLVRYQDLANDKEMKIIDNNLLRRYVLSKIRGGLSDYRMDGVGFPISNMVSPAQLELARMEDFVQIADSPSSSLAVFETTLMLHAFRNIRLEEADKGVLLNLGWNRSIIGDSLVTPAVIRKSGGIKFYVPEDPGEHGTPN